VFVYVFACVSVCACIRMLVLRSNHEREAKCLITMIKYKESDVLDHNDIDFKTTIDVSKIFFFENLKHEGCDHKDKI